MFDEVMKTYEELDLNSNLKVSTEEYKLIKQSSYKENNRYDDDDKEVIL